MSRRRRFGSLSRQRRNSVRIDSDVDGGSAGQSGSSRMMGHEAPNRGRSQAVGVPEDQLRRTRRPVLAGRALGGLHVERIGARRDLHPAVCGAGGFGRGSQPLRGQWQVSTAGGIYPRWRPDGKELYYIGPNGEMMAAPITATGRRSSRARRWRCFPRGSSAAAWTMPGPAIRRHPRRPLPDQHGPGRRLLPHHAHSELESRGGAVAVRPCGTFYDSLLSAFRSRGRDPIADGDK